MKGSEIMDLSQYDISQATHKLKCRHCMNSRQSRTYYMSCIVIKDMGHRMLKVVVFGSRYWKNHDDIKHVRYVPACKVTQKK